MNETQPIRVWPAIGPTNRERRRIVPIADVLFSFLVSSLLSGLHRMATLIFSASASGAAAFFDMTMRGAASDGQRVESMQRSESIDEVETRTDGVGSQFSRVWCRVDGVALMVCGPTECRVRSIWTAIDHQRRPQQRTQSTRVSCHVVACTRTANSLQRSSQAVQSNSRRSHMHVSTRRCHRRSSSSSSCDRRSKRWSVKWASEIVTNPREGRQRSRATTVTLDRHRTVLHSQQTTRLPLHTRLTCRVHSGVQL
jgi:hypothetical protein